MIAILYGGRSGEHEVSLLSAASVIRHIKADPDQLALIGISQEGLWQLQSSEKITAVRNGSALTIDPGDAVLGHPGKGLWVQNKSSLLHLDISIVFPVLHGTFGEDGTIQGYLDILDLPYVGSGVLGSALGMDKAKVKMVWQQAKLPIVPFTILFKHEYRAGSEFLLWDQWAEQFGNTLFIKPARGGSSVGISKVGKVAELAKGLDLAFQFDTKVIIEPAIDAREIEVSVTGNDVPRAYTPGEIMPSHQFYDYDAKYVDPNGARLQIPAELDEEQQAMVRNLAVKAYIAAEAAGLSRVDFFLDRKTGNFILNEINTMPGFTTISMFPKMCEASGLSYSDLIDELLDLGHLGWNQRKHLRFSK